jgi:hypothetical protein
MEFLLALLFVVGLITIVGDAIYWVLTKLHLTKRYKLATETIVKDLGYTMNQYFDDSYVRYVVTQEWLRRLER